LPGDARSNREFWDRTSDEYQAAHGSQLNKIRLAWGVWQIPEEDLRVLGDVAGKDILELGCGAAQWSIALAGRGARPVGVDNSQRQLEHARRLMAEAGVDFRLVHASADDVPLPDASFDVALPYGEWIRLFRRHGFVIEHLLELQAPDDAESTYFNQHEYEWARRWPAEIIWRVRLA
jgi:SAM-dependent methyltransferase